METTLQQISGVGVTAGVGVGVGSFPQPELLPLSIHTFGSIQLLFMLSESFIST